MLHTITSTQINQFYLFSADMLLREYGIEGVITNHHLIAYSLSKICVNNYQNRLTCVEVIVCNISVVF